MAAVKREFRWVDWQKAREKESHRQLLQQAVPGRQIDFQWMEWKYAENPYLTKWKLPENLSYGYLEEGNVLGVVNYMPYEFTDGNKKWKAVKATNIFISDALRGQGIFSKILQKSEEELAQLGFDFLFVFPNFNSLPGLLKAGYSDLGVVDTFFYFTSVGRLFYQKFFKRKTRPTKLKFKSLQSVDSAGVSEQKIGQAQMREIWHKQAQAGICFQNLENDFVKWRYLNKPGANYFLLQLSEGSYLIYTIFERNGLTELFLADLKCTNKKSFQRLLKALESTVAKRPVHLVRAIATDSKLQLWLKDLGFLNRKSKWLKRFLPQRRFVVKPLHKNVDVIVTHTFDLRDCDQDKP